MLLYINVQIYKKKENLQTENEKKRAKREKNTELRLSAFCEIAKCSKKAKEERILLFLE